MSTRRHDWIALVALTTLVAVLVSLAVVVVASAVLAGLADRWL